ncbi:MULTISPECIES: SRPBCC family protein [Halobacterium]|uniref:Bacterio-opsin linked product n=4 Tax=Halobacterium salinarum TaxID=2242 RepID=Q9HPU9_HALSA|nr:MULTISPECIES: SRPBCC family protein [Halobacterium]AAG19768.1 bacterio-opsin linked product [Halobacterium salinarum NRC-1]MBB6088771.1 carbon monoxide dehydrogenase subunit G [Halobacterium salinarum]MCF2165280.1 SRPBCC family protein [Halobacterium salinarum]MCF2167911.1 SRPBCC family protein [Halobacterium salinarum]MCF2206329.1 SRPBCC family protein [Halobacterium salinarum]
MFTVEQQATIDAPPGDVFSFLDDPRNHVKITPGLITVTDVEALASGGKRAKYRYKLAGVELVGTVEDIERVPERRLVQELTGAIDGTITYRLSGDDTTSLTYEAEYDLPDTVIESVLAPIAKAYNKREAAATVDNLTTFLEH